MKKAFIILLLISNLVLYGQGEANIWYFGENAGLDFNGGTAIPQTDGKLNTLEGCSTFSDSNGNLLFYSDGSTVWDRNHQIMPNGVNLKGNSSSTQSAMIIPKPLSNSQYYLFTVGYEVSGNEDTGFGFYYYTIDLSVNGGFGDVVAGPIDLNQGKEDLWTEKVAAIKGAECNTYWVISLVENTFVAYKISPTGVESNPVISIVPSTHMDRRGYLKISPDGQKIAVCHMYDEKFLIYDFNDATGVVSNERELPLIAPDDNPYGAEFSGNSKKLYVHASNDFNDPDNPVNNEIVSNHHSSLYQFDVSLPTTAEIINSRVVIDSRILYRGALQLGPDLKIYRALSSTYTQGISYLGVIENPNEDGLNCNYKHNGIDLLGKNSTQGLPPFIASLLLPIEISDNVEIKNLNKTSVKRCAGDNYTLTPENIEGIPIYTWTFNNVVVSSSASLTFTSLEHASQGIYYLNVETTDDCGTQIHYYGEVTIEVYDPPSINKPLNIMECDTDNDGFMNFDLHALKDVEVLNEQSPSEFEVFYFNNQIDADENQNPILTPHTNSTPYSTDIIIARIQNSNNSICYKTESFAITVYETPFPPTIIANLSTCDSNVTGNDTDGLEIFDLTQKESEILNGQTANKFNIRYYTDVALLSEIINPASFPNSARTQTIYVYLENKLNTTCNVITSFQIKVTKLPVITNVVTLKQCDDDIDGISAFNLTEVNDEISDDAANETFTYYTTLSDAIAGNSPIPSPTNYNNQTLIRDTVWAAVTTQYRCSAIAEIQLFVSTTEIPASFMRPFNECDDFLDAQGNDTANNNDRDGIATFDFSSVDAKVRAFYPVSMPLIVNYYRNKSDALAEENPISDISNYRNIGYPNTQNIYVRVDSELDNDCRGLGHHITLNVEALPVANQVNIGRKCDDDDDGMYPFDTSLVELTVLNGQTNVTVSYFDQNNNPLQSPFPDIFLTASQTITIRVTKNATSDPDGPCFDETTLEFIVDDSPVAYPVTITPECDDDFDGLFDFDTSSIEATLLGGQTNMEVHYYDQSGTELSPLPNPFTTGTQIITVQVENKLNTTCIAQTTFEFIVHPKPNFSLDSEDVVCLNKIPEIVGIYAPDENNYSYEWMDANGTIISNLETAEINAGGTYTVIATSINGCESDPHQITLLESNVASLASEQIEIVDDSQNNVISIITMNLGIGDYEFAIQKEGEVIGFFQDEPIFENLEAGIYTVFVNDKKMCGMVDLDVSIIGYPKFFTPNNDGYNDYWNVIGVNENFYPTSLIYIFDRFGKVVAKVNPVSQGWNGLFNGRNLPASDYWFSVELLDKNGNRKARKGHFSLIR